MKLFLIFMTHLVFMTEVRITELQIIKRNRAIVYEHLLNNLKLQNV